MLRAGAVAAAILVVALPAAGDTPSQRAASRDSQTAAGDIPAIPNADDFADQGFPVQRTTGSASKAKVNFTFPDVYMRAYLVTCFGGTDTPWSATTDIGQRKCSQLTPLPLPAEYQNGQGLLGGAADTYIVAKSNGRNSRNTYGELPPVTVRALAFGSIPVSATVQLSQTVTNGYVDPIKAQNLNLNTLTRNTRLFPGFPPLTAAEQGDPGRENLTVKNQFDATLKLKLSNVSVDGRPVDVGSRCGTVSPVRLTVREPLGFWNEDVPATRLRGLPGHFLPLDQTVFPGYFDGNVDVPAFANCGSATEDLDPLLTALVSSPTNHVSAFLPIGISLTTFCDSAVADNTCTPALAAAQRRMKAVASAVQQHKSPAEIRKLQAKLKPSDYVMPRVKANTDR